MAEQLTMEELVSLIERLGKELHWKSRYMDLAATTAGAVFRSLELDEGTDTIPFGTDVLAEQMRRLEADLGRRGRTANTASTYVTTWKRLTTVSSGWAEVRGTPSEQVFWDNIGRFRDTRPKRRHPADEVGVGYRGPGKRIRQQDAWKRIEIPLDDGVVVLTLPHKLNQSEAYQVIDAVIAAGAVDRA